MRSNSKTCESSSYSPTLISYKLYHVQVRGCDVCNNILIFQWEILKFISHTTIWRTTPFRLSPSACSTDSHLTSIHLLGIALPFDTESALHGRCSVRRQKTRLFSSDHNTWQLFSREGQPCAVCFSVVSQVSWLMFIFLWSLYLSRWKVIHVRTQKFSLNFQLAFSHCSASRVSKSCLCLENVLQKGRCKSFWCRTHDINHHVEHIHQEWHANSKSLINVAGGC